MKDLSLFLLLITHMGCIIDANTMSGILCAGIRAPQVFILLITDPFLFIFPVYRDEERPHFAELLFLMSFCGGSGMDVTHVIVFVAEK